MIHFDTFTKLPKTVRDLGKLIVAKGAKKSPNLVTLVGTLNCFSRGEEQNIETKTTKKLFLKISMFIMPNKGTEREGGINRD